MESGERLAIRPDTYAAMPLMIRKANPRRPSQGLYTKRSRRTSLLGPREIRVSSFNETPIRPSAPVLSPSASKTRSPVRAGTGAPLRTMNAEPDAILISARSRRLLSLHRRRGRQNHHQDGGPASTSARCDTGPQDHTLFSRDGETFPPAHLPAGCRAE